MVSNDILQQYLNFDPTPYVGNQVLKINNRDPIQYLTVSHTYSFTVFMPIIGNSMPDRIGSRRIF